MRLARAGFRPRNPSELSYDAATTKGQEWASTVFAEMNIPDFTEQEVVPIVDEWVDFARAAHASAEKLSAHELADHARVLLLAVAADLREWEGARSKHEKSQGNKPDNAPDITRIACAHAAQRFEQGFSFDHLAAEFRALRASVIRRWTKQVQQAGLQELEELTRFGEAMDQAFAASISLYTSKVDESRNLLLGVLGHDLRTPLGVVHMSASYLLRADTLTGAQTKAAARILTSAERMGAMVKDILDFTKTVFGVKLPITPAPADLGKIAKDIVDEVTTLHPDSTVELACEGELTGRWDVTRIGQALCNVIANAVHHGAAHRVKVRVAQMGDAVTVQVHNQGEPIPAGRLSNLFSPLRQDPASGDDSRGSSGLGLGLYITKEIAAAHGGSVEVTSGDEGISVCLTLPRTPPLHADRRAQPGTSEHKLATR